MPDESTRNQDRLHRNRAGRQIVSEDMRNGLGFNGGSLIKSSNEEIAAMEAEFQQLKQQREKLERQQLTLTVKGDRNSPQLAQLAIMLADLDAKIRALEGELLTQRSGYLADQKGIDWGKANFCNVVFKARTGSSYSMNAMIREYQNAAKANKYNNDKGPTTFYIPHTDNGHYMCRKVQINSQGNILFNQDLHQFQQSDGVSCALYAAVEAWADAGVENDLTKVMRSQPVSLARDNALQATARRMIANGQSPVSAVETEDMVTAKPVSYPSTAVYQPVASSEESNLPVAIPICEETVEAMVQAIPLTAAEEQALIWGEAITPELMQQQEQLMAAATANLQAGGVSSSEYAQQSDDMQLALANSFVTHQAEQQARVKQKIAAVRQRSSIMAVAHLARAVVSLFGGNAAKRRAEQRKAQSCATAAQEERKVTTQTTNRSGF